MAINDKLLSGASADGGLVPSENFNTVLYTGNGTTTQSITGVGFQPDMVWVKARNATYDPVLASIVNTQDYYLTTSEDYTELIGNGRFSSFDTDGFTVTDGTSSSNPRVINNQGSTNYVAWCFKASGGTKALNEEGTIDSQVSANTAAGFSVVEWTGDTNSTATVGHGLSSPPDLYFLKGLDNSTDSWIVSGSSAIFSSPLTNFLRLNTTDSVGTTASGHVGSGSTTINVGVRNYNTQKSIAYCFHSVPEYSKVGSYVGNNSTTGNHIECGFEPAWVIIKQSSGSGTRWVTLDNKRNTTNPRNTRIFTDYNGAEDTDGTLALNFTTTGFQYTSSGAVNASLNAAQTYIFYAVAADPDTTTPTLAKSFNIDTYTGNGATQQIGSVNTLFTKYAVFNGSSSYMTIPTIGKTRTQSFSFWFRTNTTSTSALLSSNVGTSTNKGVVILMDSGSNVGKIRLQTSGGTGSVNFERTSVAYNDGQWHHLVAAYDCTSAGDNTFLYIDGLLILDFNSNQWSSGTSTNDVHIGANNTSGAESFKGQIDQFRVYNAVLTASQVTELNNETATTASTLNYPTGAGCLALYEFNDNADDTGNNYDGTIANITYDSFLFKPDLVIIKNLTYSGGSSWSWADTLRGVSNDLRSDGNYANRVDAGYRLTGFNDTGFSVTDVANGDYGVNGTPAGTYTGDGTYVAYSFKMLDNNNNVPIENEVGTIDSLVSANPSAGMSIVSFTGTGSAGSIGHGLSSAPEFIILKNLDGTNSWAVRSSELGNGYLLLNSTAEYSSTAFWGTPTASVFNITSSNSGTILNNKHIAYCFHSVSGFSKFGSYTGDTSTYPTISAGFQPNFVMIKRTDSGDNWLIFDTKRDTSNPTNIALIPNSTAVEGIGNLGNGITIGTDGFVLNSTDTGINANNGEYIYWAMKIN